ncbi:Mfa1 fimbrilin C-terminal domain-containing protein [Bacteroides fragilis]|nr:Mfa1 fimbrilin C-terminal domain-containing protein [Bacteroides fragilis]
MHFYYQGVCYYTVLIRHFSNNMVPVLMGYGRYGVVRNNVYQLSINKIIGPGQPVINPPEQIRMTKTLPRISADVNIMRWYIRNQNVEELL